MESDLLLSPVEELMLIGAEQEVTGYVVLHRPSK